MPTLSQFTKNKGDRSDRNHYRCISLFGCVGKLFATVALRRLQGLEERESIQNRSAVSKPIGPPSM